MRGARGLSKCTAVPKGKVSVKVEDGVKGLKGSKRENYTNQGSSRS